MIKSLLCGLMTLKEKRQFEEDMYKSKKKFEEVRPRIWHKRLANQTHVAEPTLLNSDINDDDEDLSKNLLQASMKWEGGRD